MLFVSLLLENFSPVPSLVIVKFRNLTFITIVRGQVAEFGDDIVKGWWSVKTVLVIKRGSRSGWSQFSAVQRSTRGGERPAN